MKNLLLLIITLFSFSFLTSCSTYNELAPSWAEICSKPTDEKDAAWYKPCNFKRPDFKPVFKD